MRTHWLSLSLVGLVACGGRAAPTPPAPAPRVAPEARPASQTPAVAAIPFASIRERSGCAFESIDALCAALHEHVRPRGGPGWVSDGCAVGPPQTSGGDFAEARVIGVRSGDGELGDRLVEQPLLGGHVRQPAERTATTHLVLAARVGSAWFPITIQQGAHEEPIDWSLDPSGASLTWTDHEGGSLDEPYGYGRVERTLAVVDRGVPIIAAQATIDSWRSDVDLACTRECNRAASPPPYPACDRRCASRARATRTWQVDHGTVRVGASQVERTGPAAQAITLETSEAQTLRLDAADPHMIFCAFMPVVHAVPRTSQRSDPESVAARDRAHELLARGGGRELRGARAAARPGGPRSIVAIDAQVGGGCGGGGCTIGVRYRTVEGTMPEEGMSYFADQRGPQVGCDASTLPTGQAPTLVEVALATSREAVGCGFIGWDGSAEQIWVVVRVLEGAR